MKSTQAQKPELPYRYLQFTTENSHCVAMGVHCDPVVSVLQEGPRRPHSSHHHHGTPPPPPQRPDPLAAVRESPVVARAAPRKDDLVRNVRPSAQPNVAAPPPSNAGRTHTTTAHSIALAASRPVHAPDFDFFIDFSVLRAPQLSSPTPPFDAPAPSALSPFPLHPPPPLPEKQNQRETKTGGDGWQLTCPRDQPPVYAAQPVRPPSFIAVGSPVSPGTGGHGQYPPRPQQAQETSPFPVLSTFSEEFQWERPAATPLSCTVDDIMSPSSSPMPTFSAIFNSTYVHRQQQLQRRATRSNVDKQ